MSRNKYIERKFRWAVDENTGMDGWLPAWLDADDYTPVRGYGAAHDILEHGCKDKGKFHEEFIAFGRMMFIRKLSGFFEGGRNRYTRTTQVQLGEELVGLWIDAGSPELKHSKKLEPLTDYEEGLVQGIVRGLRSGMAQALKEERLGRGEGPRRWWYANAADWLRAGFRDASNRYDDWGPDHMLEVFQSIERAVTKVPDQEGEDMILRVRVNVAQRHTETELFYPDGSPFWD